MKSSIFPTELIPQTITELVQSFLAEKRMTGKSESTVQSYASALKVISTVIDFNSPVESVKKSDIVRFIDDCKKREVSEHTIEHYLKHFRVFMNWCKEEGYSAIKIMGYSAPEAVKETYSDEDLQKLLRKPNMKECNFAEYRNWVIVNFLIETGCRASSLIAIRISDIDFKNSICQFRHNKTGKVQSVPISEILAKRIGEYLKVRGTVGEPVLFPQIDGTAMTYNALRLAINRYNKSRDVDITSIHAFRHTFAKNYLLSGGDPFRLQKILNHSTLEMTKHYCRLYDTDIVKGFESHSTLSRLSTEKEYIKMR